MTTPPLRVPQRTHTHAQTGLRCPSSSTSCERPLLLLLLLLPLCRPQVVQGIYSGVTTWELDTLAAETCAYMNTEHPHYARLAARISVSNLQRATSPSFAETVEELHAYVDPKTGRQAGYISDEVKWHADLVCDMISYVWSMTMIR